VLPVRAAQDLSLTNSLPWYFGVAIVAAWVGIVIVGFVIVRQRRRLRPPRRPLPELIGIGVGSGDGREEGRYEREPG
jgi:hypothetical protein